MKHIQVETAADMIRAGGIIAIVRGSFEQKRLLELAEVLRRAGYTALEVTMNSAGAPGHIRMLSDSMGAKMLIGAGTVRSAEQAREAVTAGAQFLVSPGFDAATVAWARSAGILHLPGVLTPTEIQAASDAGCALLKLFPSEAFGPAYLKALRAPFNEIGFVPTGGISAENVAAWRQAGAVAVAAGSTLIRPDTTPADLKLRAEAMRGAWNGAAHAR